MPNDSEVRLDLHSAFELLTELLPPDRMAVYSLRQSPATVYNILTTLLILTLQRFNGGHSLQTVVREVVGQHTYIFPDNKRVREGTLSSNPSGFSKARQRLSVEYAENFCDEVAKAIIRRGQAALRDRQVYVVDGTTVALTPTSELTEAFPPSTNQFGETVWPILMLTVAHELYSGAALRPEFGAKFGEDNTSEAEQVETLAKRLEPGSILLADSGYGIFRVVYRCHRECRHDIIARLTNARFQYMKRKARLVSDDGVTSRYQLDWRPSAKDRKNNPDLPQDAMVCVHIYSTLTAGGEQLHVVSTMDLEAEQALELYGLRYTAVEHDIRDLKVTLNLEQMAAKSPEMVKKELLCSMVAYNLIVQFRRAAADKAKVRPRRISFTRCYDTVRVYLLNFGARPLEDWVARYEEALAVASKDILRKRPGRKFPRKAYPKRPKSTNAQRYKRPPSSATTPTTKPPDG